MPDRAAPVLAVGFVLFDTPIGACALAWDAAQVVTACRLPAAHAVTTRRQMVRRVGDVPEGPPPPALASVPARIAAVLQGAADSLEDVPLALDRVPPFHRRVYEAARRIAPGQTVHYGELAAQLGDPGAARAVGQALGANPFAPIVPCHRVLAAGGRPGGFSAPGGLTTKLRMLELERASFGGQPGLF